MKVTPLLMPNLAASDFIKTLKLIIKVSETTHEKTHLIKLSTPIEFEIEDSAGFFF